MTTLVTNTSDYENLLSYKKADTIYRLTYFFCHKFMTHPDRTVDQMIQAARSGKQNIVEGVCAAPTSSKTEIRLLNVAKASLHELLTDYKDYLHVRQLEPWEKGSIEYETMRRLGREHNEPEYFVTLAESRPAVTIARMAIILIKQADFLLHRQIEAAERLFLAEGGFSERMTRMRLDRRNNRNQ